MKFGRALFVCIVDTARMRHYNDGITHDQARFFVTHSMRKYIYSLLLTAAAGIVLLLCIFVGSRSGHYDQAHHEFRVTHEYGEETILPYEGRNGRHYAFLPSGTNLNQVEFLSESGYFIRHDGGKVASGMTCGALETGRRYAYGADGQEDTLQVLQSGHVAAMYIDTATGSMDRIHASKEHEESASLRVVTAEGELDFGTDACTIKGHGNSTWFQMKKPYTITLETPAGMLGMGSAQKWILISNVFDETSMRNTIVYGAAARIGRHAGWSPDHAYVDLYLGGEYAGLYQLTRKIEAGAGSLALEEADTLFEMMASDRDIDHDSFAVSSDRMVEMVYPKEDADGARLAALEACLKEFTQALYAEDGVCSTSGKQWSEYIDLDSWARKYLIEEVFSNYDAGQNSQYFWLDASENRIFAGPCWDYDLTIGKLWNTYWTTPHCMLELRGWADGESWYGALMRKEEFADLVVRIYEEELRPVLMEYIDSGIGALAQVLEPAVKMNNIRWSVYSPKGSLAGDAQEMVDYLRARVDFLDSMWIKKEPYCVVTIHADQVYNIYVPENAVCSEFPEPKDLNLEGSWVLRGTDTPFDPSLPVTQDADIESSVKQSGEDSEPFGTREDLIALMSIGMLCFLMLGLAAAGIHTKPRRRRRQ